MRSPRSLATNGWYRCDVCITAPFWDEFAISISKQTLSRELRRMGFRKLSARPRHHAQNEYAIDAFKKNSPPSWRISRGVRPRVQG